MKSNANRIVLVVAVVLVVATLVLVFSSGSCSGSGGGVPNSSSLMASKSSNENQEEVDDMTVDEFRAMLDSVSAPVGENARSASRSAGVQTTSQAMAMLSQRGFADLSLLADYALDGTYQGSTSLDQASSEKYPSYKATYTSITGVAWVICINDGSCFAVPIGTTDGLFEQQYILSEKDYVTQYDGTRNEYSDFALANLSDAKGIKVDRVDKATLDSYTIDAIEKL